MIRQSLKILRCEHRNIIKGALYSLRQFLATESPFKMTKNTFHFTLKALFTLEKFKFLF